MDNIEMSEAEQPTTGTVGTDGKQQLLTDLVVTDENMAFNILVSFLGVAQKRGTFSIAESAKIFECINKFVKN
jgi:hypothetical protein